MINFLCLYNFIELEQRIEIIGKKGYEYEEVVVVLLGNLYDKEVLNLKYGFSSENSDEEIVCKLYLKYGYSFLKFLIGDYSLVIYDRKRQKLIISRDAVGGTIPLFFSSNSKGDVVIATSIKLIIQNNFLPQIKFDETYFANFLTYDLANCREDTPFIGINRVKPGHCVLWENRKCRVEKVWNPSFEPIQYSTTREYIDHFKDIFIKAVNDRIHYAKSVSVDLSGGLDSSSIVCLLEKNDKEQRERQLTAISLCFPKNDAADERVYIESVLCKYPDIKHIKLEGINEWMFKNADKIDFYDEPNASSLFHEQSLVVARASQSEGATVHLTGHGGDVISGTQQFHLSQHLKKLNMNKLWREISVWAPFLKQSGGKTFFQGAIYPFLPLNIKRGLVSLYSDSSKKFDSMVDPIPIWMEKSCAKLVGLDPILSMKLPYYLSTQLKEIYRFSDWTYISRNIYSPLGIEVAHPFLDQRLIEFMLKVPSEIKMNPPYLKILLREAMKDILPERVRVRATKGEFSVVLNSGIKREQSLLWEWADKPMISELGIIKRETFCELLKRWSFGIGHIQSYYQIFALEHWLRTYSRNFSIS